MKIYKTGDFYLQGKERLKIKKNSDKFLKREKILILAVDMWTFLASDIFKCAASISQIHYYFAENQLNSKIIMKI